MSIFILDSKRLAMVPLADAMADESDFSGGDFRFQHLPRPDESMWQAAVRQILSR